MSIATFTLAEASIADVKKATGKKLMPKRIYTASPDQVLVPEPR